MSTPHKDIRWVSSVRGLPILYVLLTIPVVTTLAMAYGVMCMFLPAEVRHYSVYGLVGILVVWFLIIRLILTGPDRTRPAQVQAAAQRLGLAFAPRAPAGEPVLPDEFPLARCAARWASAWPLISRRHGPLNVVRGVVGGHPVCVVDVAYPVGVGAGRGELTAAYFPDPVAGLPDWPKEWSVEPWPGTGTAPPEPFKSALAAFPDWTTECRAGRLVIYKVGAMCHPDSYGEFVAVTSQIRAAIIAAAASPTLST
jgi:hypothetical protein